MNQRLQGTLITLAIMFVFVALGVRRRMRPQPVRPNRIVLFSPVSPLSVLSADLLLVTIGLWLSRAVLLVLRHREHVSGKPGQQSGSQPRPG